MVEGYPLEVYYPIDGTPTIGDIDGDSKNEIVVLSGKMVYAWDTDGDADKIEWGSYRHDNYNTGNYDFVEPCFTDNNPITVSNTIIWSDSRRIYSDIIIEPGATLTIKGNLGMSEDVAIYVKPGAELKVEGGSIRAACDGQWQGIEVWGNSDADQNDLDQNGYLKQGIVTLIDATIEDAFKGVLLGRTLPVQYPEELSDYNGGIISANNTTFRNNEYSVMFKPYSYVSVSSIDDCHFEFDDNPVNGIQLKNFVSLYDYEYLSINGCNFEKKTPLTEQELEEFSGIYSIDSHVSVDGLCVGEYTSNGCTEIQNTYFSGLFYGIYAANIASARSIDVRHSTFDENVTGIYLGQVDYSEVVLNTFIIPDGLSNTDKSGLYIDMSTGYIVQQNDFNANAWVAKQHGIVVNESGVNENLIYNNTFSNLKQAIKTQGINQGVFEKEEIGLEIRCNEFIACEQDIRVMIPDNPLLPIDAYGIKPIQGNNGPSITDPAGNRFSKFSTLQFKDIENDGIWIRYWHHPTPTTPSIIIPDESSRLTNSFNNTCPYFPTNDPTQACPLKYNPDEMNSQGGSSSEGDLKAVYDSGTSEVQLLNTTLSIEIDGGDTPEMVYDVETSNSTQSLELRDELLGETPYLSDTVIKSAIEKEDVLNNAMIYDIMNSNPKSGRSEEILSELDTRQNPMPQYMKNVIIANSQNMTTRDSLEAMIAHENQQRQDAFARLLAKYRVQVDNPAMKDSIIDILHNYRINEQFIEVLFKYQNGDQTYQSTYNTIPVSFDLTSVEEQRYDILGDYITLIELTDHEYIYFEYDSLTFNQFMEFAEDNTFEMKLRSQIALRHFDKTKYSEPYEYEGTQKTTSSNTSDESLDILNDNIEFYPNPAGEFIIIDYFSRTNANNIFVKVFDMNGKHMLTAPLQKAPSSNTIDLRSLGKGTYLFSIYEDGVLCKTEKVTHQ